MDFVKKEFNNPQRFE